VPQRQALRTIANPFNLFAASVVALRLSATRPTCNLSKKEKTEAGEANDDALLAGADNEHRVHPHADGHPQGASSS